MMNKKDSIILKNNGFKQVKRNFYVLDIYGLEVKKDSYGFYYVRDTRNNIVNEANNIFDVMDIVEKVKER